MADQANRSTGTIVSKEECVKKNSTDKYWKFKIKLRGQGEKMMSLWEHPAGIDVSTGDNVEVFWTDKQSGTTTYHNINSIAKRKEQDQTQGTLVDNVGPVQSEGQPDWDKIKLEKQQEIQHGMVSKLTIEYIMHQQKLAGTTEGHKMVDKFNDIYDVLNTLITEKRKKVLGR